MLLSEFAPTKLSTLLTFLANRLSGDNKEMPMSAVISTAQKMGIPLSYPALKKAYDNNPELQNLIADISQDSIILKSPETKSHKISNQLDWLSFFLAFL